MRHQGESATALVLALAQADLAKRPKGQLIYQDVAGLMVVSWPKALNLVWVLLCLLLFVGLWVLVSRQERANLREMLYGFGLFLGGSLVAVLAGWIVSSIISWVTRHPKPWWAIQSTFSLLYAAIALVGGLAGVMLLGKRTRPWGIWMGVWGIWLLLTLCVAFVSPAFTAIFLVPLAVALLCGAVVVWFKQIQQPPLALPWLATLLLWWPMTQFLNSVGFSAFSVLPVLLALSPLFPVATDLAERPYIRLCLWGGIGVVGLMTVVVILQPRTNREHPIEINIVTVQDAEEKQSHTQLEVMWHFKDAPISVIPKALAAKVKLGLFPGYYATGGVLGFSGFAKGPAFAALPPKVTLSSDGASLTLESQRGATSFQICTNSNIQVHLPDGAVSTGVLNMDAKLRVARYLSENPKELRVHRFYGPEHGPLRLTLVRKPNTPKTPLVLWVGDLNTGVAPVAASLAALRGPFSLPFHSGDRSLVGKWIRRPPQ